MPQKAQNKISFHSLVPTPLKNKTLLKLFLLDLFKKEGKLADEINYIFCSDEYLLELNQKFLSHDTLTDIITFEHSSKGAPVRSDVYISVERVKENAASYKVSTGNELLRVIFHGALHLCGYKDKTAAQKRIMRNKEDEALSNFSSFVQHKARA